MGFVLVAPDKFKGSLSASGVADAVAAGFAKARPNVEIVRTPVADGGDGTLDAAVAAGFRRVRVTVRGPTGELVEAAFGVREGVAVVELAVASGLVLLPPGRLFPLTATSFGTGQLVAAALDAGCDEVVIAAGGSACTDGGAGMLQALGARLLAADGRELGPGGAELGHLAQVDLRALHPRLSAVRVILASDVDNPLLGPQGAAAVYGPQKGATPDDVVTLDAALSRWSQLVDPAGTNAPGAGAAGGVGYAALSVLRAVRRPGIEVVLDLVGFYEQLPHARLVITGEGSLDRQTLNGKAPAGVAAAARAAGVPVVAVCGRCELDTATLASAGIAQAYPLVDIETDLHRCMSDPWPLLHKLGARIAADQGIGLKSCSTACPSSRPPETTWFDGHRA